MKNLGIDFDKYFTESEERLHFSNDSYTDRTKTYKANQGLRKCVEFKRENLTSDINQLEDNSNTVFLCRNVLPYIGAYDARKAVEGLGKKLKKGSVIALGGFYNNKFLLNTKDRLFIQDCGFDKLKDIEDTYVKTKDIKDNLDYTISGFSYYD